MLAAMSIPGTKPFQEVLIVVRKLFEILVYVNFGSDRPIIYKDERIKNDVLCLMFWWHTL